jgi:hypothetical protein
VDHSENYGTAKHRRTQDPTAEDLFSDQDEPAIEEDKEGEESNFSYEEICEVMEEEINEKIEVAVAHASRAYIDN